MHLREATGLQCWRLATNSGSDTECTCSQTESTVLRRCLPTTTSFNRCATLAVISVVHCSRFTQCHTSNFLLVGQQQHNEKTYESDSDEYSDEEDPGYSRQDIRGQEAFISRELDLSDDEGSHRGPLSFQSPSPAVHPGSSSGQASSYMAEPPGTSVYDSEAPSEQSHSTSHHPDSSSIHMSQPFNLTLRPDPTILGSAEANTAAASNQDTSRTEQSSASSASFTGTDKSRTDAANEAHLGASSSASDVHAEASNEQLSQPSILHQTSGIRYLLDGVLEKVSDAFTRHQPRSTPRPTDVSDPPEEPDDEEEEGSQAGTDLPMIHSGNVGIR